MAEMQWFDSALDTWIAPRLSSLTHCGADELPVRENLLPEFVLNSIFTVNYGDQLKKKALNLIRHVDHAALAYDAGRSCVLDYLSDNRGKRVTAYFSAVSNFETHVAHLNMARWLTMHIARPAQDALFPKGSDCFDARLQALHIEAKHLNNKTYPFHQRRQSQEATCPTWPWRLSCNLVRALRMLVIGSPSGIFV
jgi:hypothetical protein